MLMACIVFARVALPTLGADSVFTLGGETVSTLGGVVGVVFVLCEFTLAPAIPVVRSFPIFCIHWSISVPGVPGGNDGPPGDGFWTVSRISLRRRLSLSVADVSGSSQHVGKNSMVLETRDLLVLGM